MVKIVRSVALVASVAVATCSMVHAADMSTNPVTNTPPNVPLDSNHPAQSAPVKEVYTVSVPANVDVPYRLEGAANADVSDLETYLGESLEADFNTLKEQYAQGEAPTTPWPGSYWPTYQDSINVQWKAGEASPAEKYANAYGFDPTDFMNKVSADNGIDSHSGGTACSEDADCSSLNDGSVCAKRAGQSSGYCIPTWYGICHAWSPAAILEAEPQCDVVKNGQTFHVMDIKALLSDVYDGASISTVFTGVRFNGPDIPADVDQYGRYTSAARRDLGAGFFHLAVANLMGKYQQSFVVDVTAGAQVWNQPVRSYSVKSMEIVDMKEASMQYFGTETYPFNSAAVFLAYVELDFSWVVEAYADGPLVSTGKVDMYTVLDTYTYLLELDANQTVIGGEWVGDSLSDHPDFLWFPTSKPDASTVTSTGLTYSDVEELLRLSISCSTSTTGTSTTGSTGTSTTGSTSILPSGSTSTTTTSTSSSTTDSLRGTGIDEDVAVSSTGSGSITTHTDTTQQNQTGKTTSTTPYADDSDTPTTGVGNYTPVLITVDSSTSTTTDTSIHTSDLVADDSTNAPTSEPSTQTEGCYVIN